MNHTVTGVTRRERVMIDFIISVIAVAIGTIIGVSIMWHFYRMDEFEERLKWFERISGMEEKR